MIKFRHVHGALDYYSLVGPWRIVWEPPRLGGTTAVGNNKPSQCVKTIIYDCVSTDLTINVSRALAPV